MKTSLRINVSVLDENMNEHEKMAVLSLGPAVAAPVRAMIDKLLAELDKIGVKVADE